MNISSSQISSFLTYFWTDAVIAFCSLWTLTHSVWAAVLFELCSYLRCSCSLLLSNFYWASPSQFLLLSTPLCLHPLSWFSPVPPLTNTCAHARNTKSSIPVSVNDLYQPQLLSLVVWRHLLHPTGWALLLPPAVQLFVWARQNSVTWASAHTG